MNKKIEKELQKLEMIRRHVTEMQRRHNRPTEKEKFICKDRKGAYEYYIDGKYVGKKKIIERIKSTARKEYWNKILPVLNEEIPILQRALLTDRRLSDVYLRMHRGKQILFTPDYVPVELKVKEFEMAQYEGLPFREEDPTDFVTGKGERVRSKSEKIIADELARQGIPYKYEKPLQLNVDGVIKTFYPDFTVMNVTTGEIKYMEHFGMLDSSNYLKNTLSKLDVYEKNGLLIGREVILIHESAYRPLNTRVITDYIREFLS